MKFIDIENGNQQIEMRLGEDDIVGSIKVLAINPTAIIVKAQLNKEEIDQINKTGSIYFGLNGTTKQIYFPADSLILDDLLEDDEIDFDMDDIDEGISSN